MSTPMIVAAAASFILGLCGYILWRFTVQPIWRYRSLKRRIGAAVAAPASSTEPPGRLADEITALYHGGLPQWYRLVLRRRNEDPLEAAKHLAVLINPAPQAARTSRVQQIRRHLGLEESR